MMGKNDKLKIEDEVERFFNEKILEIISRMKFEPITLEDLKNPPDEDDFLPKSIFQAEIEFRDHLFEFLEDTNNKNILYEKIMQKLNHYLSD